MKVVLICFCFLLCASCANKQGNTIEMSDFPVKEKLVAEHVPLDRVVAPGYIAIQSKYLCTYSIAKDTMIDLFSLPDLVHLKSFGVKGAGPDEFQSFPMPCKSTNDYVYINGYTPYKIKKFSLDANLDVEAVEQYVRNAEDIFGFPHVVQDSVLVYHSMGDYSEGSKPSIAIKKMNLRSREMEKISFPTSEPENISFDPNRGMITVNDEFIMYLYRYKKQIDIYGVDSLDLVKRLVGKSGHPLPKAGDMESIVEHYKFAATGKNYFYALYNKNGYKLYDKNQQDANFSQSLEVYDYSGKPVAEYIVSECFSLFAIDEVNSMMYAYDSSNEDYLLRYKLPRLVKNDKK